MPGGSDAWRREPPPPDWELEDLLGDLFDNETVYGPTWAVAVAHRGAVIYERYSGRMDSWSDEGEVVGPETRLLSWSVAKSVLHAAVGILVGTGRMSLSDTAVHPLWRQPSDPRGSITLEDLLTMRDGLDFVEDYDPTSQRSDVIEMLFGGVSDMAGYAASKPLAASPGSRYSYSSGTSNIVSGTLAELVGFGEEYAAWLDDNLFRPLGMTSAQPTFDDKGTWVASSYLRATATDWLRFGELYLRDGLCADRRILPSGWVDHARRARSATPEDPHTFYGAHWWMDRSDPAGTFWADGYEGQTVTVCPGLDLVAVRFGKSPPGSNAIASWRRSFVSTLFARSGGLRQS